MMNRSQKLTIAGSGVVVACLVALAAPAVISAGSWAAERFTPVPTPSDVPSEPAEAAVSAPGGLPDGYVGVGNGTSIPEDSVAGCDDPRWIHLGGTSASVNGDLVDRGAREFAAGTATVDGAGRVVTYTVAPGDALYAIGERFCIANALTIATLNHTRTIQPGEILLLAPDSSIPWVPYFNPPGAPAGYQQIPYQLAVEAMGAAAAAGELEAMRTIFTQELSGLFPHPETADMIARALDAGDLAALRQMFA